MSGPLVWVTVILLLIAGLTPGCASRRGPDWNALIGQATLDETIRELGPPLRQAELQDGSVVAEWLVSTGRVYSTPGMPVAPWGPWGTYGGFSAPNVGSTPSVFLLLTFGPDQKLSQVRQQYK